MKTPFELLQLDQDCDDAAVKQSYIAMVRRFPPEQFPEDFQRIRAAYEAVKTEKDRLALILFDQTLPTVNEIILDVQEQSSPDRPNLKTLQKLLAASVKQAGTRG